MSKLLGTVIGGKATDALEGLTIPSGPQAAEITRNLSQHIFSPSIIGIDASGNIFYSSQNEQTKNQIMKLTPQRYSSLVTLNLQKVGGQ